MEVYAGIWVLTIDIRSRIPFKAEAVADSIFHNQRTEAMMVQFAFVGAGIDGEGLIMMKPFGPVDSFCSLVQSAFVGRRKLCHWDEYAITHSRA